MSLLLMAIADCETPLGKNVDYLDSAVIGNMCHEEDASISLTESGDAHQSCNLAEKDSKSFIIPDFGCFNLPVSLNKYEEILVVLAQQVSELQLYKRLANYEQEMKILLCFNQPLSHRERQDIKTRFDICDQNKTESTINIKAQQITINGKVYSLGGKSWKLMRLLFEKRNEIVTDEEIINNLWSNYEQFKISPGPDNVTTVAKRLRDKIEDLKPFKYILRRTNEDIGYSGYMFNDF
jgi:hypothetical protein